MPKLRVHAMSMSLDGYVAGPDQSLEHPLGVGGERAARVDLRDPHRPGDDRRGRRHDGVDDDFLAAGFDGIGA